MRVRRIVLVFVIVTAALIAGCQEEVSDVKKEVSDVKRIIEPLPNNIKIVDKQSLSHLYLKEGTGVWYFEKNNKVLFAWNVGFK